MIQPPEIKKLDESVINRIAAGEIIQRPANALKELIENSLDAKSTNIQVTVKNGGLKLLQIQDNGVGIRKEDLDIVCERFTTSKLRAFEDLQSIATYGFRGEALASISHIAHLTIISKSSTAICAYKVSYIDSKLQDAPRPIAGNQGTIIIVEDLFYNMNVRKKALRSPAEEYQKVSEVVSKYAIHNATVGFCLKKSGDNNDIRTMPDSTCKENIRIIYGNSIARELIEFSLENHPLRFKASGQITNVNYSTKKFIFLLFINHRLVDCQSLKKCIDQVYTTYLPKNTHPFVYLSLELDPANVDVNVHPTKHEVHFLNEEQIVEAITTALEAKLLGTNNSRVFYTQAKLPNVIVETFPLKDKDDSKVNKPIYAKELVRTDSTNQKLDKFFGAPIKKSDLIQSNENLIAESNPKKLETSISEEDFKQQHEEFLIRNEQFENMLLDKSANPGNSSKNLVVTEAESSSKTVKDCKQDEGKPKEGLSKAFLAKITRVETELTSVLELRKAVEENCHRSLRDVFAQHVFVGCIDTEQALIQYSTKLYLCSTQKILCELFYQFILYNFQNFSALVFPDPLPIYDLALIALEQPEAGWTEEDGDKKELAEKITEILTEKGEMLNEYFSMEIDENGHLKSIPLLLDCYFPSSKLLPMYMVRLATEVNWDIEKECFDTYARETAFFYSQVTEDCSKEGNDWKWVTEHVLYPAIKEYFIPPKTFVENAAVLEIANLPNLYKVFERC